MGAIKPNPDPTSRGRPAPTGSGRPRVLSLGGRPGCGRSYVYNHETLNIAIKVGRHLISGQQLVQKSRDGETGLAGGPRNLPQASGRRPGPDLG